MPGSVQGIMEFVGRINEFGPKVEDLMGLPDGPEKQQLASQGRLFYANDNFTQPGLYMWTGHSNVLIKSKRDLAAMIEADVSVPSAPPLGEGGEEE